MLIGGIMYHYQHHIGDFNNATRHLNRIERSLYRDLIELYYDTESILPNDLPWICRKIIANEHSADVERLLNEFFVKVPDGWFHSRCDKEIDKYKESTTQKALAGKASAAKRKEKVQHMFNGRSTDVQHAFNGEATNQEPITINHKPKTTGTKSCLSDTQKIGKKFSAITCELPDLVNPAAWIEWAEARSAKKKPISENAAKKQWAILSGYSFADQQQIVDKSIANDYQGLFHLDGSKNNREVSFVEKYSDRSWADGFIERHTDDGWRKGL